MKNTKFHDLIQDKVKKLFNSFDIDCVDEDVNSEEGKKPDLKCEKEKIIIEIKTFQGDRDLKNKEDELREKFIKKELSAYWVEEKPRILERHIKNSAKKFEEEKYKEYKTIIIITNRLKFHDQSIKELFENNKIYVPKSVGVVLQIFEYTKEFVVFYNKNADETRKLSEDFFDKFKSEYAILNNFL